MNIKERYKEYLNDIYGLISVDGTITTKELFDSLNKREKEKIDSDYTYQEVFKLDNSENDGKIMKLEVLKTRNRRGSYVHSRNVQALSLF